MRTLITGFNSDIAKAFIRRRKNLGDTVIATTTEPKKITSNECQVVGFDLSRPEKSSPKFKKALGDGIDILILNAAGKINDIKPLHELPLPELQNYLRANIEGNLWLIHQVLGGMKDQGFGRILFISSISSTSGTSGYGIYCCAKAALEGLIGNLAVDYGEYGIYSNVLRPGIIATSRTKDFWSRPGYQKIMSKTIPAGTLGGPEQVAEASDVLLSKTSYINGAVLDVSGGLPRIRSRSLT